MAQIVVLVDGGTCQCKFGTTPDKIKVTSHKKEFANDGQLIATTLEVGSSTFQANSFGSCNMQRNKPCKLSIVEWKDYYEAVVLSNGGYILLENSIATCPIGGAGCITVINHGQIEEPCQQNAENADPEVTTQLNPLVDISDMGRSEPDYSEIIIGG